MEWLDEADQMQQRLAERRRAITEHEGEMYSSLWEEVKRHVAAARSRESFAGVTMNGQPECRIVSLPLSPLSPLFTFQRQVTVSLLREKHQILAEVADTDHGGSRVREALQIDVNQDNIVCLTRNGVEVSLKDAAIYILRPFLYPELPEYEGVTTKMRAV